MKTNRYLTPEHNSNIVCAADAIFAVPCVRNQLLVNVYLQKFSSYIHRNHVVSVLVLATTAGVFVVCLSYRGNHHS